MYGFAIQKLIIVLQKKILQKNYTNMTITKQNYIWRYFYRNLKSMKKKNLQIEIITITIILC